MAKNTSESRIPLPRAARPSFLPKPKIISPGQKQTGGIGGGGNSRRSTILAGCFLTDHNLDLETPRRKFSGSHFSNSTPFSGSDRASHVPSIWSLKSNDCHQRDLTCDKDGDVFTNIPKDQTLLEDIGDSCLIDPSRNGTSEIFNSLCKDQTLLEDISCVIYPSYSSTIHETSGAPLKTHQFLCLTKQNSFECDESLGILTPDQMTDFTVAQGCSRTPSCENLSGSRGLQPATTTSSSQGSRPTDIQFSGGNTEGQILLSERSPSLEELPLDPKPVEKLLEQQIVAPLIATVPSTTTSANALPMSFVTSATSIASLEAGYQGDGENSRPASRGADPPRGSIPGNLPTSCRLQDPMTDSDFFTESDADAHEDIGRGDRKAQVIDGTLFCAPTEPRRRCPSFAGEEMDSSGIYSDLDKRQDERFNGEINEDRSPDTANTPDTVDTQDTQVSLPAAGQLSPSIKQEMPPITMDFLQVQNNPLENSNDSSTSINHEITVIQVGVPVSTNRSFLGKHSPNKTDSPTLIKYKMPKKNVESKIKAMISTTKDDSAKETKRAPRRKNGHWDAIMSKIEAGKTEQRSRPQRKEVKSRVMQSLTASASSTPTTSSSSASSKRTSEESNSGKAGSDKRRIRARQGITSPNQETARSSVRSSLSDISAPPAKTVPKRSVTAVNQQRRAVNGRSTTTNLKTRLVTNDAKKSGTLDLSPLNLEKSPRPIRKSASLLRRPATTNNNGIVNSTVKQTPTGLDKDILRQCESNLSTTISPGVSSIDTCQQATQTDCEISNVLIDSKQTETAVGALCLTIQYLSRQNDEYSKKVQEALSSAASTKSNLEEKLSSEQEAHEKALRDLCTALESEHASRIEELENALSKERSVFEERLRESLADLQRQHEEAIDRLKAQHNEELEAKKRAFEEETKQQATPQLDNKYEEELIALKVELKDMRATVKPIFVIKNRIIDKLKHENSLLMKQMKEQRNKIQRLENELEEAKNSNQLFSIVSGDHSSSLQDEIWSLRSVLELRSQENSSLRSEMEILRDELEQKVALEQRVETLEARCEDLKAQLESKDSYERDISQQNELVVASLREISKHNKRLAQKNEELVYRLRQKSEVVSVLANQLATPPRLSRSLGPENIEHTPEKPASSSSPMIKFMVQKGDSVSWTLEIDESCEAQPKNNGATTPKVPRANSMRMPPRKANDFRARSKSVSTAESMKENNWGSMYSSTPVPVRRRPRSDPSNSPAVQQAVNTNNELQAGPRPQEAGGEAMISEEASATSSDDESSASTDMPRLSMEFGWSDPAE